MIPLNICSRFNIDIHRIVSIKAYGSGHIHETYKVGTSNGDAYILQRINQQIFKDIPALQSNIEKVLDHMAKSDIAETNLEMLRSTNDKTFFEDDHGEYWRVFIFIPNSKTYDRISSTSLAMEGGKAFGSFLNSLHNFNTEMLSETLPEFHHIESRINLFEQSVKKDKADRANLIHEELDFVRLRVLRMKRILELGKGKKIPLRITHNDTKINNVLFDKDDKAICVIDLDTVMPGYIHYDFGDAIRTGAASAAEDEADLSKMFINLKLFEAYSRGFLEQTIGFMNQTEIDELYFAPQLLTFIIALRFLTDYINGDIYFKVEHEAHNLQRWFAQKQLLISMEKNEAEMKQIIKNIVENHKT